MRAKFLSALRTPSEQTLVLRTGESVFPATLAAGPAETLEELRTGTVVEVTGVYGYEWGSSPSFRLFLRSADDVKVIAAAPWWTLRHSAVMAAILALGACGAAFWVRTAARRRRQQYQAVLTERTRLARELHDTLEQGLAGIALQLEAVGGSLAASPEHARQSLDVARRMLQYSQEEARRSVMDLRAQALERSRAAISPARSPTWSSRRRVPPASMRRSSSRERRGASTRATSTTCCASDSKR
jgi:signal transduction histidine kinase